MTKRQILSLLLTVALTLSVLVVFAGAAGCPVCVDYNLGTLGVSADLTSESVASDAKPTNVPKVVPLNSNVVFSGWSLTDPATLKPGEKAEVVDPTTVRVTKDTVFYAVYTSAVSHNHFVIGYPNGNFGPGDDITRGSVATIIARAVLEGFVEGANYGNPGNFSDVSGHWAESAIAYCAKYGAFKGYSDGKFYPDKAITRQEFALVIARLGGLKTGAAPFSDIDDAADWAKDGIYTTYAEGWVTGYPDGTFKPLNNIRRDEAVKIFNGFLKRGVNAEGLSSLKEYVHTGVASNNTENGQNEYMTWPDVPKNQWAYYEIIEAANDHEYVYADGKQPPETWTSCKIDEKWRYHDDITDGAPQAKS